MNKVLWLTTYKSLKSFNAGKVYKYGEVLVTLMMPIDWELLDEKCKMPVWSVKKTRKLILIDPTAQGSYLWSLNFVPTVIDSTAQDSYLWFLDFVPIVIPENVKSVRKSKILLPTTN